MEEFDMKRAVETLLFITDHPLPVSKLAQILSVEAERVTAAVAELQKDCEARGGPQILEIAGGFQMATLPAFAPYIKKIFADKMTMRLSAAALETLSIIAYRQPITRAEIEEIRGVDVIAALESLLDKRLIKVVDRRESVGRPLLYGTTPDFMRHFGLKNIQDLPPIESFTPPAEPGAPAAPAAEETAPSSEGAPSDVLVAAAVATETASEAASETALETVSIEPALEESASQEQSVESAPEIAEESSKPQA